VTPALLREHPLPTPRGGKEDRGRVLVVGGSDGTPGAVLLAAEAALRSGAGKLQVGTVRAAAMGLAVAVPEALVVALPSTADGVLDPVGAAQVRELAAGADCLLMGPGLADPLLAAELVGEVVAGAAGPTVLDALALAAVTADVDCVAHLDGQVVLTPNPEELAIALHADGSQPDERPDLAAARLAKATGAVVSVGGATSWTAAPDGGLFRDDAGGPGLGVSGAGDVRAGLVAGLLARGADPLTAALWAAHVHGRAGERLSADSGPLGYLAREITLEVPAILLELDR
jgi:hydroxyethylthiazole kinase-like uncharacterized protein yjeF